MTSLIAGGNCVLPGDDFEVRVRWISAKASLSEVDVSAFVLGNTGKVASDSDMVFYGQTTDSSGAVRLKETNRAGSAGAREALLDIDLRKLRGESEKVAITSTLMDAQAKRVSFKDLQSLVISIYHGGSEQISFDVPVAGKSEAALIVGEFYKRNGQWKFRAVGQGFNGGLKPLAEGFGVSIEAEPKSPPPPAAPAPSPATPPPPPTAPVNLSKITLTKAQPKISLAKQGGAFGEIKINLNWNKRTASKGLLAGIFGGGSGIDLDLRCLFELKDGSKGAVQALGRVFGDFDHAPFIRLMGDDRTGANNDGEWMRINGARWDDIKRIIVFDLRRRHQLGGNRRRGDGVRSRQCPDRGQARRRRITQQELRDRAAGEHRRRDQRETRGPVLRLRTGYRSALWLGPALVGRQQVSSTAGALRQLPSFPCS